MVAVVYVPFAYAGSGYAIAGDQAWVLVGAIAVILGVMEIAIRVRDARRRKLYDEA